MKYSPSVNIESIEWLFIRGPFRLFVFFSNESLDRNRHTEQWNDAISKRREKEWNEKTCVVSECVVSAYSLAKHCSIRWICQHSFNITSKCNNKQQWRRNDCWHEKNNRLLMLIWYLSRKQWWVSYILTLSRVLGQWWTTDMTEQQVFEQWIVITIVLRST
jgi:hypothetical protein